MTKSELITTLLRQSHLSHRDVELAVSTLLEHMSQTLAHGKRIEIPARIGRNPATGDTVAAEAKHVPRFRPGKELRERVTAT